MSKGGEETRGGVADAQASEDVMGGSLCHPPSLASAWTFDECDGEGGIITLARSERAMRVVNTTEACHKPLPLLPSSSRRLTLDTKRDQ